MATEVLSGSGSLTVGSWFTIKEENANLQFTVTSTAVCKLQASWNSNSSAAITLVSVSSNSVYKPTHIGIPLRVIQDVAGTSNVVLIGK